MRNGTPIPRHRLPSGARQDRPIRFWISASQYEYWQHTHLAVEVVKGRGSGFSVEAPEGVRFLIRSRLFTDDEWAALNAAAT
jgi:uncharacterized protein